MISYEAAELILEENSFNELPFPWLKSWLMREGLDRAVNSNIIESHPEPLPLSGADNYPLPGSSKHNILWDLGMDAIRNGEVGVVILNGGMATRFGGCVKGIVPAHQELSFLHWKIKQVEAFEEVPIYVMNSFSTENDTLRYLGLTEFESNISCFNQYASMRLTPDGELYTHEGKVSLYATGHGDLPYALRSSYLLHDFTADGGKYLMVSNVDNLGASLDPVLIGMHIASCLSMSVELVHNQGEVGGFPAQIDGRWTLLEAFRAPNGFDMDTVKLFNTNTYIFDAAFLERVFYLDWFVVPKIVDGQKVVQFERLVGQLADYCDVNWLHVPRDGAASRFIPIKTPEELEARQPDIAKVLGRIEGGLKWPGCFWESWP